eukprot:scaffold15227_cov70-Cyclotella_meneghiniana.AAC.8
MAVTSLFLPLTKSYLISPPQPQPRMHSKKISPIPQYSSTGLKNNVYDWRGQQIRYIASGPEDAKHTVLLIHGLFVNADTWRHTLSTLGDAGYRTYAIDLLGSGYSSKPLPSSLEATLLNGENGRFREASHKEHGTDENNNLQSPIRTNVILGTASGERRVAPQMKLRHPLNSCYNFYTWAEQINDFTHDVIFNGVNHWKDGTPKTTSLIANSKGCIVALQACLDNPETYNGLCVIDPTYREMHETEMKMKFIKKPVVNRFQRFLRNRGHRLYNFVTTRRGVIGKLLCGPYYNHTAIDDELLTSITEPLNLPQSADIVFDELSYTTGPLFEQQLQDINDNPDTKRKLIWVMYGKQDPWLHPKRVDSLITAPFSENGNIVVDKVIPIDNAGHCPHDERPEVVGDALLEFLQTCNCELRQ